MAFDKFCAVWRYICSVFISFFSSYLLYIVNVQDTGHWGLDLGIPSEQHAQSLSKGLCISLKVSFQIWSLVLLLEQQITERALPAFLGMLGKRKMFTLMFKCKWLLSEQCLWLPDW